MPLSIAALTTPARVFDELDIEDDAGVLRARVETYIEETSDLVAAIIGRPIHYDGAVAERLEGPGGVHLLVARTPVVAIADVAFNDSSVGVDGVVVVDASIGKLYRSGGWPWTAALQRGPSWHPAPGTEAPSITVTYAGGWVTPRQATPSLPRTLPHSIEGAVLRLITARWRGRGNDPRLASSSHQSSTYTFGGEAVPPEVMAALAPHQRIANA